MDDRQKEPIDPVIIDWFTNTLLPFFSWLLSQLSLALFDCKLAVIFRHPTLAYKRAVTDSWVEGNFVFSCAEILSFTTASGRRRARKKLKAEMRPFFRQLAESPECAYIRHRFREIARENSSEIPDKATVAYDITEVDKRIDEQFTAYTRQDILETFPLYEVDYRLSNDLKSQLPGEDYCKTVRSILWEANYNWDSLCQIRKTRNNKIWDFLGIDPSREPSIEVIEAIIDKSLDFAQGKIDPGKMIALARWLVERVLALQFLQHPYSDKRFVSTETPIADDLTLGDTLPDDRAQEQLYRIENLIYLREVLPQLLPTAEWEACDLYLQAGEKEVSPEELCHQWGKNPETVAHNFRKALRRLGGQRKF